MNLRWLCAGAMACSSMLAVGSASAAPAAPCIPATMTPRATAIPINFPGFAYTALTATAGSVQLKASNGTVVPLDVGPVVDGRLKVVPSAALTPGTSYELTFEAFCGYGPFPAQGPIKFTATASAPLPTKIGDLVGQPTVSVKDFGTSRYTIAASYALADEMKPWASAYELLVTMDGKAIESRATIAATGDGVQVEGLGWCDDAAAQSNTHRIGLRARLPFSTALETAAVDATFTCPKPSIQSPPPGNPTAPAPGATATASPTSSSSGGSSSSKGCSIGATGTSSLPLAGIAIALVALRRRRAKDAASSEQGGES